MNQWINSLVWILLAPTLCSTASLAQPLKLTIREINERAVGNVLQVTFENIGAEPVSFVLGTSLGNGTRLDPSQLSVEIELGKGQTREYRIMQAGILEGRIDPWTLSLPAHSLFRVTICASQLYDDKAKRSLTDEGSPFDVRAKFVGAPGSALSRNSGEEIIPNPKRLWIGTVYSNVLRKVSLKPTSNR